MHRPAALIIVLALLLAACGGSAEQPTPTNAVPAVASGWAEPFDETIAVDPAVPFLGGELISYAHDNGEDFQLRPVEFGGRGLYNVARPRVIYSDGTELGTRVLLDAVLETGRGSSQVLAVSTDTFGYFIATSWAKVAGLCASTDGATCPGDETALYWTDGSQSAKLAALPRAGSIGSVRDIAVARQGDRGAACLLQGGERLTVSCYEGTATTPREVLIGETPNSYTWLVALGSRLYIFNDAPLSVLSYDPFTEATSASPLEGVVGSPSGLFLIRANDGSATSALLTTKEATTGAATETLRAYALSADGMPELLHEETVASMTADNYVDYRFDALEHEATIYLTMQTYTGESTRNQLYAYDAKTRETVFGGLETPIEGSFELLSSPGSLWAVGERAVYEVTRAGLVERDRKGEEYDLPTLIPTKTPGEAYLGYRRMTASDTESGFLWFHLTPGAAAAPVVDLAPGCIGGVEAIDGVLYLLTECSKEDTTITTIDGTTVGSLDLAPAGTTWNIRRLRAINNRLLALYEVSSEPAADGTFIGVLTRFVVVAPR